MSDEALSLQSEQQVDVQASAAISSFKDGSVAISANKAVSEVESNTNPEWSWSKETPGEGKRPDWLPENTTVEDMAKRAVGLRKQLSQKVNAPEEYALEVDEEIANHFQLNNEDPLYNQFKEKAKEYNMTQEAFTGIMNMYLESMSANTLKALDSQESQFKELGINAEETFERVSNWADNNLPEDSASIMKDMSLSAPQMKLMTSIIDKFSTGNNLPGELGANQPMTEEKRFERMKEISKSGTVSLEEINKLYGIKPSGFTYG
jgi:hypothetical protein